MKKITLILASLFFGIVSTAQLQEEGFSSNSIPTGWTSQNTTACDWVFGFTGNMPGSGGAGNEASFPSGAAFFDDSVCGALSKDRILLTGPTIDLDGDGNTEIVVVYNLQVFGDKGEFIVEVFDGSIWQEIYFQETDSPRNTGENQTIILDVTSHNNTNFAVRFIYDDEGISAMGLAIDNYKLSNSAVASVNQLADFEFKYSPNPVSNILSLFAREDIDQINIYNLIGQNVLHHSPTKSSVELDMNNLINGPYFVHVQIDNKIGSFKILKQ